MLRVPGPTPLAGFRIVNVGVNLPAGVAAARLAELGALVTKVEPPEGDPLHVASMDLYERLTEGHVVTRLNLKMSADRDRLRELLAAADVLLTSSRPSALARLGLAWSELEGRYPRLVQVAIVGHVAPDQERPGHDLTYVARHGLVSPPSLPPTLVADLGGAERAVTGAVALLLARERGDGERYTEVALADSAQAFALPRSYGLTVAGGVLGGGLPFYGLYEARGGWVAVAALEPRFRERLVAELGVAEPSFEAFKTAFVARTPAEWERWADDRDLPIAAVRAPEATIHPT
jgi:crotonobetainyl-CoA:carnitine CoA-transferase CaiB-like acyl-CoA transferase